MYLKALQGYEDVCVMTTYVQMCQCSRGQEQVVNSRFGEHNSSSVVFFARVQKHVKYKSTTPPLHNSARSDNDGRIAKYCTPYHSCFFFKVRVTLVVTVRAVHVTVQPRDLPVIADRVIWHMMCLALPSSLHLCATTLETTAVHTAYVDLREPPEAQLCSIVNWSYCVSKLCTLCINISSRAYERRGGATGC